MIEDELMTFVTELTAFGQVLCFDDCHDFGGFDFCLEGFLFCAQFAQGCEVGCFVSYASDL